MNEYQEDQLRRLNDLLTNHPVSRSAPGLAVHAGWRGRERGYGVWTELEELGRVRIDDSEIDVRVIPTP